ncbi:MAG: hypothetical protein LBL47_03020 [Lactobacillus sp.]|jgi:hypothetical protein|nr:hypothetical protein [Lactobacillus sp.]
MKKVHILLFCFMIFLSGCISRQKISAPVTYAPHRLTEVDAMQKIYGEASATYLLQFIKVHETTNPASKLSVANDDVHRLKETAIYYANRNSLSDTLVSPTYIIETSNYLLWKTVKVKVIGRKAMIKGHIAL